MKTPVIIVNFKTYGEVMGPHGLELAKTCARVAWETGASIAIAPQNVDLGLVCREVKIPVLAQHADDVGPGSHTGHTSPNAVKAAGAAGTLINHSEYKIAHSDVKGVIERCRELGLVSVACADNLEETEALAWFKPDYIAVEPPELIGGNVSVTSAKPEVVSSSVEVVRSIDPNVKVLCGAGVKTMEDVRKAIELGTVGVLLASGVVKAQNPGKVLMELVDGLR